MSEISLAKPADLLRRLRRLATKRGWDIEITEGGKHTKVYERPPCCRAAPCRCHEDRHMARIIKQLGLMPADLED